MSRPLEIVDHSAPASEGRPLTILVADDHAAYRSGLKAMLGLTPGLEIIAEAATGSEAVEAAERLGPDVVVMDMRMPDLNGIEATRRLAQTRPHVGVLMLTMFEDDESVFAAVRAGARGFVLKGAEQETIVDAIRAVAGGERFFGTLIDERVTRFVGP